MMLNKLWEPAPEPSSDDAYYNRLKETVRRLEKSLGSSLSKDECIMLAYILTYFTVLYDDGFSINDPEGLDEQTFGYKNAASVAACFSEDRKVDSEEIYQRLMWGWPTPETPSIVVLHDSLVARILSDPTARPDDSLLKPRTSSERPAKRKR